MELSPAPQPLGPFQDKRPRIYEALPVQLVAVEDCSLTAAAGLERDLDDFYVKLLGFEREDADQGLVYRAENCRLLFTITERRTPRPDMRTLGIAVHSLPELIQKLQDAQLEFTRQRGLIPGLDALLIADPASNPLEITEFRLAF
jgi:hypothetical protein